MGIKADSAKFRNAKQSSRLGTRYITSFRTPLFFFFLFYCRLENNIHLFILFSRRYRMQIHLAVVYEANFEDDQHFSKITLPLPANLLSARSFLLRHACLLAFIFFYIFSEMSYEPDFSMTKPAELSDKSQVIPLIYVEATFANLRSINPVSNA